MASTFFRDVGGGRRRAYAKAVSAALCLLLISTLTVGCDLDSPASPNDPDDLTGQTTNQSFTFNGSIIVAASGTSITADDTESVTVVATIRDASGDPVPNLTTVTFSSNIGGFLSTDAAGNPVILPAVNATTFNGQATATFLSRGRIAGPAIITVSLGTVTGSTSVNLEIEPVEGSLSLAFGTSGEGTITMSGVATEASPLDATVGVTAEDTEGNPIAGATVRFIIVHDSTDEQTDNDAAEWLAGSSATTGSSGTAANVLRVFGPGDIVIEAQIFDPNLGTVVATSNRIFLTTKKSFIASLAFSGGGSSFTAAAPYTQGIVATATDLQGNPQEGLTVRFEITDDTTDGGASLSTSVGVTDASGTVTSSVTVPDDAAGAGSAVSIQMSIVDSSGAVLATSNVIIASGT